MVDDDGVQFRLDLEKTKRAHVVARMCEVGSRAAMSVGCDILDEHDEIIAGQSVRVVERARLREITLCKEGAAGDNAFAMLVDTRFTPKPVAGSRSPTFQAHRALHKVARTVRTLKAQMATRHEQPTPIIRSMTVDQLARWQTAEYEELAANARAQRLHSM